MEEKFDYKRFLELVNAGMIDEAFDYRATFTPDYLFKFYSLTDNPSDEKNRKRFHSLENNLIWFAKPQCQNDPYEFKAIYWEDEKLLAAGVTQPSIDYAKRLLFHQIALAAFSANMNDNLSMWAHYSNNHQGFCVKYKVESKRTFRNIIYSDYRIPVTNTFLNFLQQGIQGTSQGNTRFLKQAEKEFTILQDKFFCKHKSWEYENEYRALYPFDGRNSGLNVPITELGLVVEEIYGGINCSTDNKKKLAQIASALGVPYKECSISETDFTVFQIS